MIIILSPDEPHFTLGFSSWRKEKNKLYSAIRDSCRPGRFPCSKLLGLCEKANKLRKQNPKASNKLEIHSQWGTIFIFWRRPLNKDSEGKKKRKRIIWCISPTYWLFDCPYMHFHFRQDICIHPAYYQRLSITRQDCYYGKRFYRKRNVNERNSQNVRRKQEGREKKILPSWA